ncbi:MAG: hypothetical protein EBT00_13865 [Proteobacteria bacterium]|nr:hypothetical protein [Pseudomonadota bacterium]
MTLYATLNGTTTAVGTGTTSGTIASGAPPTGATGTWSITTSALADGVNSIKAVAIDGAGNRSSDSTALLLTIDTIAPRQPWSVRLDSAYDTGTIGDGYTYRLTYKITGMAETDSDIVVYAGGTTIIGTVTVPTRTTTRTVTTTPTITTTRTITPTKTMTVVPSATAVVSLTPSRTVTTTRTVTPTRTITPTPSKTFTRTVTPTKTMTRTVTPTRTATP